MIIRDHTQKGTLPEAELNALLHYVASNHWKDTFREMKLPVLRSKQNWFCNLKRGEYYYQIPLTNKKAVLDIGSGAGVISQSLSSTFSHVYSLKYNPKWIKFMSKRFEQEKVDNILMIRGNAVEAPFKLNSFDLVVVNGVLEWVADFSLKSSPKEVQLRFLKDIFDLIGPGGKIAIAAENRLYLRWFLAESPHGEPSYVVIMPRFLANYYCKKKYIKNIEITYIVIGATKKC